MGKYDFDFDEDLSQETSLSLLVNMIKPNSTILEFGPANGRMTKYLKEQLHCAVHIVEIDEDAYKDALAYAVSGYLGDIETYEWVEAFKHIKFDYIIFADVLEHLRNPEKCLKTATKLLHPGGEVLLSIPNIAHNAILIELFKNQFTYRDVGLLDNTHIHFFTYYSLQSMLKNCNYTVLEEKATYAWPAETEFQSSYDSIDARTIGPLLNKSYGNVYQFVFRCVPTQSLKSYHADAVMLKSVFESSTIDKIQVFVSENDIYSEDHALTTSISEGANTISFNLDSYTNIQNIRLDISTFPNYVAIDKIAFDGELFDLSQISGNYISKRNNEFFFNCYDPHFFIKRLFRSKVSVLTVSFSYFIATGVDPLLNHIGHQEAAIQEQEVAIESQEDIIENQKAATESQEDVIENQKVAIESQEDVIENQEIVIESQEVNIAQQQLSIVKKSDEITVLTEKNSRLESVTDNFQNTMANYRTLLKESEEMLQIIQNNHKCQEVKLNNANQEKIYFQNAFYAINNSTFWKITKPGRWMFDKIKSLLKKFPLLYKGLLSLRYSGIKKTVLKIKHRQQGVISAPKNATENLPVEKTNMVKDNILFSILVSLYNTDTLHLTEMIQSVVAQTYTNWELCLADGSDSEHSYVEAICNEIISAEPRIKYKKLKNNVGISDNINEAMDMATGDYLVLLDHDDLLHSDALSENAIVIEGTGAEFIYSDEAHFENHPKDAFNYHFKPDFSPDTLRSYNYICHLSVFSRKLFNKVGYYRSKYDGSQDYDMVLRLTEKTNNIHHIPKILYYWRAHPESPNLTLTAQPYAVDAAVRALQAHLDRVNYDYTDIIETVPPSSYRIDYKLKNIPLVSIIIPNKDEVETLKTCIDSIVKLTTYNNYEIIIVENNSTSDEIFDYYHILERKYAFIKIVTWDGEFNYSKINNFGVTFAKGEQLVFLNNDIVIITPEWIENMLMFSQRTDVGAVGAKLYYPDNTIQHAGVILGIGGVAGHSHKHFARTDLGYFGRTALVQNMSAVTAACLMVKKDTFLLVKGLDPSFKVAFNDVDFCMRIRELELLNVFTPFTEMYHYESKSRGYEDSPEKIRRFQGEADLFQMRWKNELEKGDPYYNVNLTLSEENFSYDIKPVDM